jgi:lipoate-protein ligase A
MTSRPWRFLDTGERDGATNMAVDEALLESCRSGQSPPALRVYRWKPWTLSLGRMEDATRNLDLAALERDGIPLVRRPTGGRAVFHAEEMTYAFAARSTDLPVEATVRDVYRFVSSALVEGLRCLGVPAEVWPAVEGAAGRGEGTAAPGLRGSPCFASVSQYEICVRGRKLVGSAQRRWPDAVLQHGSILTGPAHSVLEPYLRDRSRVPGGLLTARTTTVGEVLARGIEPGELSDAIRRAAEAAWGVDLVEDALAPGEERRALHLARCKYGTDDWTLRARAPEGEEG